MADDPKNPFQMPPDMVALTEQSFDQARRAFEQFIQAAQSTMTAVDERARSAQAGGKDVAGKIVSFAEQNVANAFAYAERLVHAKDPQTLMQLHMDYVQSQMKTLSEQAKALAEAAGKAGVDLSKPKT